MDAALFTKDAPGRVVQVTPPSDPGTSRTERQPYVAFVPDPLPEDVELNKAIVGRLSEADRAIGKLSGVGPLSSADPHIFIRPFVRREAVLSSRIEGTIAGLEELFVYEATSREPDADSDVREVLNYVYALEQGLEHIQSYPVSLVLVRDLHRRLMDGVRGQEQSPGYFRAVQNYIGRPQDTVRTARYVPPPPLDVQPAMDHLEQYIRTEHDMPLPIKLALIHYQFEAIHPFRDGNGRMGRLLITLLLCAEHYLPAPLLYLSGYFEQQRNAYIDHLFRVSTQGAWSDWIEFFLHAVAVQARDTICRCERLFELQKEYRRRLQTPHISSLQLHMLDELFASPVVTYAHARTLFDAAPRSIQQTIDKLVGVGILTEISGRQRNRMYVAHEIIEALDAPAV